jgi:hypothetical protein
MANEMKIKKRREKDGEGVAVGWRGRPSFTIIKKYLYIYLSAFG